MLGQPLQRSIHWHRDPLHRCPGRLLTEHGVEELAHRPASPFAQRLTWLLITG